MQPLQCDVQPEIQEPHRTTHTDTTTRCKTHRRNNSRTKRPQPHPPHRRGTFHRRLQPLYTEKHKVFVLRLPPQNIAHATFMQPLQCDLQPEIQEPHRTTHADTTTRCKTHRREQFAHKTTPAAPAAQTRYLSSSPAATLHGKTQGFVLRLPPRNIAHATLMQPFQCDLHSLPHHFPSSPLPFVTTSLRHHFPSSPLPFVTTSLRHHFPSSPLPFVTTSIRHHPVS